MIEISVIDQNEQFAGMEAVWDELVAASSEDNPFRRWLWAWTWWKHYGRGQRLAILIAREGTELVGIAPLYFQVESFPLAGRSLRLLGSNEVCSEYLGLILRRGTEARVAPALLEFLFDEWDGTWDMLRWTDLPEESVELPLIEAYLQKRELPYVKQPGVSNLIVRLPDTWDQYLATHPSKRRNKFRRILRHFEGVKGVEYARADTPEQFPRLWEELRMLHNRHWEHVGQKGLFTNSAFNAFHTELAREYCKRGLLLLASLRVRGEPIASFYAIRLGETVYEYQRGHDPAWLQAQPGHVLQFYLFRHAMTQGLRSWDYLRGDYRHKRDCATEQRDTVALTVPARRVVAVQRFRIEQILRRLRRRLSRVKRALVGTAGPKRSLPKSLQEQGGAAGCTSGEATS